MRMASRLAIAAALLGLFAASASAAPGAFGIITIGQQCTNSAPSVFIDWSVSNTATSYTVYRDGVPVSSPQGGTHYDDASVTPGQTYNYFIRAFDGSATTDSNTRAVTAPICTPPGPFTLTATPVCGVVDGGHRPVIQLQWTDSDNATRYNIFKDNQPFGPANMPEPITITDTSPDVGSQHTYVVVASGIGGDRQASATTSAPPSVCPAPPSALTLTGSATCDKSSQPWRPVVNLSWTASTGATSYDIVKNGETLQTTTSTNYADYSVAAGGSYNYVIRANNSGGSTDSNPFNPNLAGDICGTPPSAFTISTAVSCKAGVPTVTVSWTPSSGAQSYVVYRNSVAVSPVLPASATSYDDSTVTANNAYGYFVEATNPTGTTTSNTLGVATPPNVCEGATPPTPPTLNGSIICTGATPKVHLAWSGASNATSYNVVRDGITIASGLPASANTYDDTNVATGQSHVYFVRAVNNAGTADSPTYNAQSISCGTPPPAPVATATLFCNSNNNPVVHVAWNSVAGATGYSLLRDDVSFGTTLSSSTLSFDDATVLPGQMHTYVVRASNDTGFADSNAVAITAVACPTAPSLSASVACVNGNPSVHLSWTASAGSPSYSVRRNGTSIGTTSDISFDDPNVSAGQTYSYVIRATNAAGAADSNQAGVAVSSTLCAQPHPDLAVTSVTLGTTSAKPNDTVVVSFSIANVGNAAAPSSVTRIRIGDVVAASVNTPPIPVGTTTPFSQPIGIPSLAPGSYTVTVTADDDHTTGDVNATNDTGRSTALQITGNGTCTLSCASTVPLTANVLKPVAFVLNQAPACPGATILWRFGDGDTAGIQSPFHTYQHPGKYDWSVSVTTSETTCQTTGTIEIAPIPSRRRGVAH